MVNAQEIGIIWCNFSNCSIIYPVGPVYYLLGHPSNAISLCALSFYAWFQKVTSDILEHYDFVKPSGLSWISPYYNMEK